MGVSKNKKFMFAIFFYSNPILNHLCYIPYYIMYNSSTQGVVLKLYVFLHYNSMKLGKILSKEKLDVIWKIFWVLSTKY